MSHIKKHKETQGSLNPFTEQGNLHLSTTSSFNSRTILQPSSINPSLKPNTRFLGSKVPAFRSRSGCWALEEMTHQTHPTVTGVGNKAHPPPSNDSTCKIEFVAALPSWGPCLYRLLNYTSHHKSLWSPCEVLKAHESTCNVEGLGWFLRSGIDQGSGRLPKGCRGYLTRAADHAKPVTHGRVDQVGQVGQLGLAASANWSHSW